MKWLLSLAFILAAGYLFIKAKRPVPDTGSIAAMVQNPYNSRLIDTATAKVQDGDIVVRTGNDMTSYMFCKAGLKDKTYSHCGIVAIEHGYPFVYHCIGGEDNPDEVLRRDSIKFWLSPAHNTGFGIRRFALSPAQKDTLLGVAQYYYRLHTKFDLDFDITNDNKLYCAELVYRAMNRAMADSSYITPTRSMGYTYVAVDNITTTPDAKWVWQVRYK